MYICVYLPLKTSQSESDTETPMGWQPELDTGAKSFPDNQSPG